MSDYQNKQTQFVNLGLNLRDVPDRLQPGQWRRLTNVRSISEGSITSRPGREEKIPGTPLADIPVNTLFKLDDVIISSHNTRVQRNATNYPSSWWGGPKSYVRARSTEGEEKWAFVADPTNLRMIHSDGTDYKWGITAPVLAATFAATGTGPLNSSTAGSITYDWRYTWFNSRTGAESNPSPVVPSIAVVNQNATITIQSSSDPQVDKIAIYRRGGANILQGWTRVGLVQNSTGGITFIDNNSDSSVSLAKQLQLDNDVPFTSVDSVGDILRESPVPYIFGTFLGLYIFATGDPNRPGYVYWTNPSRPTSASINNKISVTAPDEPLLGGFIYNDLPYVFSRENFYALDYSGSGAVIAFSARKLPIGRGVSAPYAIAGNGPVVFFLSKDNIYYSDMQGEATVLTEESMRPLFNPNLDDYDYTAPGAIKPINWGSYSIAPPSLQDPTSGLNSIKLRFGGQFLHVFYKDVAGVYQHLLNQLPYNRWSNDESGVVEETDCYYDHEQPNSSLLLGCKDGRVALETGTDDYDGEDIQCRARLGSDDFGMGQTLKELGNVIIDANVNGAVTPVAYGHVPGIVVTPYYNAENFTGDYQIINGSGRRKYPLSLSDAYVYSWAPEFLWNGNATIYQMDTLWRLDEELISHWEFPPTSFNSEGWKHIRDMYITLRSTGDVTIKVLVDGVTYYPQIAGNNTPGLIPSTSSAKTKTHLYMPPVKGQLFQFYLDGGPFRLYGEDCDVDVKQFGGGGGYQEVQPFIQEGGGS